MEKLISFQKAVQKKRKMEMQSREERSWHCSYDKMYECYVTPDRLDGYCELLICESGRLTGEWFTLAFSPEGLIRCTWLNREGIRKWMEDHKNQKITYLQAMRLLGDAVRQRYKYQKSTDWIPEKSSVHLRRIWEEKFYSDQDGEIGWQMPWQSCGAMLKTWFQALNNKDAALMYVLSAASVRHEARRSVFAYCWNHVLENMHIIGYEVDTQSVRCNGSNDYTLFLTVYGDCCGPQLMEVDLRIRLVEEPAGFRILQEQVLESRLLYRKQYC